MSDLNVSVERCGKMFPAGQLLESGRGRARFRYLDSYLEMEGAAPISVSLPLQEQAFDEDRTKTFFEGLLPEGFTRRTVAAGLKVQENDYLSILAALGSECLGALQVTDGALSPEEGSYELLDDARVKELAGEGATEAVNIVVQCHLSLTGASGKVGLYYEPDSGRWYLPKGAAASTHIVKQSHVRLRNIVVNEQLALRTAKKLGIETPDSFIINIGGGSDGEVLFATARYDRIIADEADRISGLRRPYRLHQEDFAQAMGIPAGEKYENHQADYLSGVYDYIIGNSDNHIKNLSLLYSEDLRNIRLAPLYDVISTVVYDGSTREMSVSIDGKYSIDEITRESFANQAEKVHLGKKAAMKRFDRLQNGFEKALNEAAYELKEEGFKNAETIRDAVLAHRRMR